MANPLSPWYQLDNAAVLYSALQQEEYSAIYRFSAVLEQQVDPLALQEALYRVMPRFPSLSVRIRRGFFWYYLEPNISPGPFVKPDVRYPCRPVRFHEDEGWLVRVYYYERRISIEIFHALADGAGALTFFRTLLAEYFRKCGIPIPVGNGVLDLDEAPRQEEMEDAYRRYAKKVVRRAGLSPKTFPNIGTPDPFYTYHVTMGFVPVDKLKEKAKSYGASITEYLAAILLQVLIERQRCLRHHREKPVALAVPINLRTYFPTETLRNFILMVRPSIDPALGDYTFPEIVTQVRHYMRLHSNRQEMQTAFSRNVNIQKNRLLQILPRVVKIPLVSLNYRLLGNRPYSATLTNPGPFQVPEEMRPHIHHMEVVGQGTLPRPHCSSISYGNSMEITFAGTQIETETERDFFRFLVRDGLPVRIESNRT